MSNFRLRKASLQQRVKLLDTRILQVLMWGAGSWNLTKADKERLRGVQRSMVRKVVGFRKLEGESMEYFMSKSERVVSLVIERYIMNVFSAPSVHQRACIYTPEIYKFIDICLWGRP